MAAGNRGIVLGSTARVWVYAWVVAIVAACGGTASASVTIGSTFSVASQSGIPAVGDHFHSNHLGAFGNPPDKAEVGSLQDQAMSYEECRGLTEFDLTGLAPGTAMLQFYVDHPGGLFPSNPLPFSGNIGVQSYAGNNADDIGDYSIAPISSVGTFSTAGLVGGSSISFNVTSLYNSQLAGGATSLGFRLQTPVAVSSGGAYTFDNFMLIVTPIPEPTTFALAGGAVLLVMRRRRRNRRAIKGTWNS